MSGNPGCTVYVGNLDDKVSERVLYDILIQAGRVVDLYIPRDRETDKPKGYAFAVYESDEIADYSVKLFSGLVTLFNRTLKFAISGRDRPSQNLATAMGADPVSLENPLEPMRFLTSGRVSSYPANYAQGVPPPPGLPHQPNGHGSHFSTISYDDGRRYEPYGRTRSRR